MPNVSLSYNVWLVGTKRKSPLPKFNTVTSSNGPTNNPTYPFLVPSALAGLPLAFVSVTGSANGHYVVTSYPNPVYVPSPSDPPPTFDDPPKGANNIMTVNVDKNTDVTISVWYIPLGSGPGQAGAYIDSFDVDTAQFFYDPNVTNDFVSVAPDGGLTFNANDLGFVPTASDETITAHGKILNVPFLKWMVMAKSGTGFNPVINGNDLKVFANTSVDAIGFYGSQNKHKPLVSFVDLYDATWHALYPGEAVDAPRPGDPNPPQLRIALLQLEILAAMSKSLDKVAPANREEIQAQIVATVKILTDGINKSVQGGSTAIR